MSRDPSPAHGRRNAGREEEPDPGENLLLNSSYDPAVPVETLEPHPENAREGDVGAIATAIGEVGFYGALLCQVSRRRIIIGNHRYQAAIANGMKTIPVIWADVDDAKALKILLGDNRHNDLATYDMAQLGKLLKMAAGDDPERNLLGTGFDAEDYENHLKDLGEGLDAGQLGDGEGRDVSFQAFDENTPTKHTCPSCGYSWS